MQTTSAIRTSLLALMGLFSVAVSFGQSTTLPMYTTATFNRALNTTLPVGTTNGQPSIDDRGGASYAMPIYTSPGTRGMEPQLSIVYNSHAGDGNMGRGWRLSGISAITRAGKNFFEDGATYTEIKLDNTDLFALDGIRLVPTSGSNGLNGTVYSTKTETFAKITSYNTQGAGPQWFKVQAKNGYTYEYGNSADSRFTNEAGTTVIMWRLNKVYDTYGNYIEYKYLNTDRDSRVDEINYTGNTSGLAPYNKIKFHYSVRQDLNTQYVAGQSANNRYLLTRIEVLSEGQTVKNYYFNYGYNQVESFLRDIREHGSDGTSLNQIMLKYGDETVAFEKKASTTITGPSDQDMYATDFNGDGLTDILVADYTFSPTLYKYHTNFKIYRKTSATSSTFTQSYTETLLPGHQIDLDNSNTTEKEFLFEDINGDGRNDILMLYKQFTGTKTIFAQFRVLECANDNATSFTATSLNLPATNYTEILTYANHVLSGDFDGDGRGDALTMLKNNNGTDFQALYHDLRGSTSPISSTTSGLAEIWATAGTLFSGDFNGDGKDDIILKGENSSNAFYVWTLRKTATGFVAEQLYANLNTGWSKVYPGDINGDGMLDFLCRTTTNAWQIAYSKGTGVSTSAFTFSTLPIYGNILHPVRLGDYNGDGLVDICYAREEGTVSKLDVYYSRGNSFYFQQYTDNSTISAIAPNLVPGDFNGDGKTELASRATSTMDIFCFSQNSTAHLLEAVKNGFNATTSFSYKSIAQNIGNFYTKGSTTAYPLNNIKLPIYVATTLNDPDGVGGVKATSFAYEQAKLHRSGLGWLGFTKIIATNPTMNTKNTKTFQLLTNNTSYYYLMLQTEAINLFNNNAVVSSTSYTNTVATMSGVPRYWPRITNTTSNDLLQGSNVKTSFWYDTNGNTYKTERNIQNGQEIHTEQHSNYGNYGSWLPTLPTTTVHTVKRGTLPAYTRTVARTYNAKGFLLTETNFSGLPKSQRITYTDHPTYGVVNSTVVSSPGTPSLAARSTSFQYDPKYRLPTHETNPLGQVQTTQYDFKWGSPLSQTGFDGLTTTQTYDAFGRTASSTTPDLITSTYTYNWYPTAAPYYAVYSIRNVTPGAANTTTTYDIFNREVLLEKDAFKDQGTYYTHKTYDARGNVRTEAVLPYLGGEGDAAPILTYSYDGYNRISTITRSTPSVSHSTSFSYLYTSTNKTVTTIDFAGYASLQKWNASGRLIEASDNGGLLSYQYDNQGNLSGVVLNGVSVNTMRFDLYGRQDQLNDTNAGLTTYDYNAYGELSSQTAANGNTQTMQYDLLGRNILRTGTEGTTTMEYHATGNGKNRLKRTTAFNGNIEDYAYDNLHRLTAHTQTIEGTAYTTSYGYTAYSQVRTVTYPSGFGILREYDANGYLEKVKNAAGTITLFTGTAMNAYGNYTQYTLGNAKTTQASYNPFGQPTRYYAQGVQDLNLNFNFATGNLDSRYDAIKNRTETFTYDNLYRLKTMQVAGYGQYTTNYQLNGNISDKSDAGTYVYSPSKLNAVVRIDQAISNIPTVQQDIAFTPFQQPETLVEATFPTPYQLDYQYGEDEERRKGILKQGTSTLHTRFYLGDYEKNTPSGSATQNIHYISGGEGICAIVVRTGSTDQYYYVYKDHLGSLLTVTNAAGSVVAEQNFDAWGRKRNPNTWHYSSVPATPNWLYRGFTGHEHLTEHSLINMNGRLYDPVLGRMLSPDNFVQLPDNTQGFNRYTYALNNPLRYTDPSGEILPALVWVIAVGAPAIANGVAHVDGHGGFWKGFAIGAAAGVAGVLTGGAGYTSLAAGGGSLIAAGVISGGMGAAYSSILQGVGNGIVFGDIYTENQFVRDVVFGMVFGGVGGAHAQWKANRLPKGVVTLEELQYAGTRNEAGALNNNADNLIDGVAPSTASAAEGVLNIEQRSLQHMFSNHAKDFGVTGNWNKAMAGEFEGVLRSHMQGLTPIQGTWRGTTPALHYYNSATGLNVSTTLEGNLLGGWKLGKHQIFNLFRNGNIQ